MQELYEADIHKPGIHGSGHVWANTWDVFRRTQSRRDRDRRVAVDFVVCLACGGISGGGSFFSLRTHTACCTYEAALPHVPLY